MFSVRGMGVAERVSTSTVLHISFSRSFWATPNRCSSSMMTSPRSWNFTSLLHQPVGADDNVHLAPAQLPRGSPPAAWGVRNRESSSTFTGKPSIRAQDGLVVLPGQDGGGHQQRALLAVGDALEGGPQGHLGLAEAHVAAQQPVHGDRPLHVRP